FQKNYVEPETAYRADDIRYFASTDEPSQGAKSGLRQIRLRCLAGPVPESDVRNLVRDHSGQFAFTARGFNRPASDIDQPARKRESIHLGEVGDFEAIWITLARRARNQRLTKPADVFIHARVGEQRQASLERRRRVPSDFYLLLR